MADGPRREHSDAVRSHASNGQGATNKQPKFGPPIKTPVQAQKCPLAEQVRSVLGDFEAAAPFLETKQKQVKVVGSSICPTTPLTPKEAPNIFGCGEKKTPEKIATTPLVPASTSEEDHNNSQTTVEHCSNSTPNSQKNHTSDTSKSDTKRRSNTIPSSHCGHADEAASVSQSTSSKADAASRQSCGSAHNKQRAVVINGLFSTKHIEANACSSGDGLRDDSESKRNSSTNNNDTGSSSGTVVQQHSGYVTPTKHKVHSPKSHHSSSSSSGSKSSRPREDSHHNRHKSSSSSSSHRKSDSCQKDRDRDRSTERSERHKSSSRNSRDNNDHAAQSSSSRLSHSESRHGSEKHRSDHRHSRDSQQGSDRHKDRAKGNQSSQGSHLPSKDSSRSSEQSSYRKSQKDNENGSSVVSGTPPVSQLPSDNTVKKTTSSTVPKPALSDGQDERENSAQTLNPAVVLPVPIKDNGHCSVPVADSLKNDCVKVDSSLAENKAASSGHGAKNSEIVAGVVDESGCSSSAKMHSFSGPVPVSTRWPTNGHGMSQPNLPFKKRDLSATTNGEPKRAPTFTQLNEDLHLSSPSSDDSEDECLMPSSSFQRPKESYVIEHQQEQQCTEEEDTCNSKEIAQNCDNSAAPGATSRFPPHVCNDNTEAGNAALAEVSSNNERHNPYDLESIERQIFGNSTSPSPTSSDVVGATSAQTSGCDKQQQMQRQENSSNKKKANSNRDTCERKAQYSTSTSNNSNRHEAVVNALFDCDDSDDNSYVRENTKVSKSGKRPSKTKCKSNHRAAAPGGLVRTADDKKLNVDDLLFSERVQQQTSFATSRSPGPVVDNPHSPPPQGRVRAAKVNDLCTQKSADSDSSSVESPDSGFQDLGSPGKENVKSISSPEFPCRYAADGAHERNGAHSPPCVIDNSSFPNFNSELKQLPVLTKESVNHLESHATSAFSCGGNMIKSSAPSRRGQVASILREVTHLAPMLSPIHEFSTPPTLQYKNGQPSLLCRLDLSLLDRVPSQPSVSVKPSLQRQEETQNIVVVASAAGSDQLEDENMSLLKRKRLKVAKEKSAPEESSESVVEPEAKTSREPVASVSRKLSRSAPQPAKSVPFVGYNVEHSNDNENSNRKSACFKDEPVGGKSSRVKSGEISESKSASVSSSQVSFALHSVNTAGLQSSDGASVSSVQSSTSSENLSRKRKTQIDDEQENRLQQSVDHIGALPPTKRGPATCRTEQVSIAQCSMFSSPPTVCATLPQYNSTDQHLLKAKQIKRQADSQSDRALKLIYYLESIAHFVLTGMTIERQVSPESSRPYTMVMDTLEMLRDVTRKYQHQLDQKDSGMSSKILSLSFRVQAVLCCRLYNYCQSRALMNFRKINEYHKSVKEQGVPNSSQQSPSTTTVSSRSIKNNVNTTPSPTPSPASSTASSHSLSAGTVAVPQPIETAYRQQLSHLNNLMWAFHYWDQANSLLKPDDNEFFEQLNLLCGTLALTSTPSELCVYVLTAVQWLVEIHTFLRKKPALDATPTTTNLQ